MGDQVAIEIVEHWYRVRTFCFGRRRLNLIPEFLEKDVFCKSLEPGLLIQHIHAHIGDNEISPTYFYNFKLWLSKIKNKNVNLHIRLSWKLGTPTSLLQLEQLGPIVYRLRKEGFDRITIQSSGGVKDFTFLFDMQETLFKENLEQWALTADPNM